MRREGRVEHIGLAGGVAGIEQLFGVVAFELTLILGPEPGRQNAIRPGKAVIAAQAKAVDMVVSFAWA
jgi:hypothetical protein